MSKQALVLDSDRWMRPCRVVAASAAALALWACSDDPKPAAKDTTIVADSEEGTDAGTQTDAAATTDAQAVDTGGTPPGWRGPASGTTATLTAGLGSLSFDLTTKTVVLRQKDTVRSTIDLGALRLGEVAAYDPERNYSPTTLGEEWQAPDLQWLGPNTLAFAPCPPPAQVLPADESTGASKTCVAVRLTTQRKDGTAGPDYVLRAWPATGTNADGRFLLDLRPEDEALSARYDKDQEPKAIIYTALTAKTTATEGFYGLGEFFDTPQHRGRVRETMLEGNFNLDGSSNEGHVRLPFLVSTAKWGWFVQSRRPGLFDCGKTKADAVEALFQSSRLSFWLFAAESTDGVVQRFHQTSGMPAIPARWAFGGLLWRDENKDQAEVMDDAAKIRQHDLPISGLWIDRPYDVAVNDFGFEPSMFPDPAKMLADLRAQGFRLGVWSTPYVDPGTNGKAKAKNHDKVKAAGWYVNYPPAADAIFKWGPPIDFTHPDAAAFWQSEIKRATDFGIEGFKLDYGEDIQLGLLNVRTPFLFHDGSDERTMHKGYQLGYHKAYAANLPKDNGKAGGGGWILARASTYGDQTQTSIIWPGDLCVGWMDFAECTEDGTCHAGGMPAAVAASISLPTSGFPLFASDTGGYRHDRADKFLFIRWLQHTALTPILQIGGGSNHNPWDFTKYIASKYTSGQPFDQEVLDIAKYFVKLHTRLWPYFYADSWRAHTQGGMGPIRALGMVNPELSANAGLQAHEHNEYWLGNSILVAPVAKDKNTWSVWLPPGEYRDWWTGEVVGLPQAATVLALNVALNQVPLYLKAGAIVPMLRPTIDTISPTTDPNVDSYFGNPGTLYVTVVPHAKIGTTWAGHDGSQIALSPTTENGEFILNLVAGDDFTTTAETEIWLRPGEQVAAVKLEGTSLTKGDATCSGSCWFVQPAGNYSKVILRGPMTANWSLQLSK
jgi:alpha-D-xyloside xylohydrolase